MPWDAPAPPTPAPWHPVLYPRCDERGPPPQQNQRDKYAGPCSSAFNTEAVPAYLPANCPPHDYTHIACQNTNNNINGPHGPNHNAATPGGNAHTVCLYCARHTEQQAFFQAARRLIEDAPPAIEAYNAKNFQTRMCRLCEEREQVLRHQRAPMWNMSVFGAIVNRPVRVADMYDFPWNTCTCLADFKGGPNARLCNQHIKLLWASQRPILAAAVKRTKAFLRSITIHGNTNVNPTYATHLALPTTIAARDTRLADHGRIPPRKMLTRACRCGADPVAAGAEEVLQCMACGGIHILVDMPLWRFNLIAAKPAAQQAKYRQNSYHTPHLLALNRPVNPVKI